MEPQWTTDLELWETFREETRLVQLLMAWRKEFQPIGASICHRKPLPNVDVALTEFIAEETRKGLTPNTVSIFIASLPAYNTPTEPYDAFSRT